MVILLTNKNWYTYIFFNPIIRIPIIRALRGCHFLSTPMSGFSGSEIYKYLSKGSIENLFPKKIYEKRFVFFRNNRTGRKFFKNPLSRRNLPPPRCIFAGFLDEAIEKKRRIRSTSASAPVYMLSGRLREYVAFRTSFLKVLLYKNSN